MRSGDRSAPFGTVEAVTNTPPGALPLPIVPGLTDLAVFARGGYATVYRAVQRSVGREVAVKVENRTLDSERDQARFLREARAAGRMSSHPHVVDLFDVGVTVDQHPYLIMELCDGSYAERMRTAPLGAAEARDLGVKIGDALAHAHASGVLHRDVKPANILHSHFNPAVLADFGLAVLAEVRDSSVTLEVLTPAYAPPEMFGHSPPSPAVDVYALCATLYAVMRGKPPRWQADRDPSLITLLELFGQPIPDLPGIPRALVDVLRCGMANDPADRPSAEQLRDLLAAVPLGPSPAGYPSLPGPPATPLASVAPFDDSSPTVPTPPRRHLLQRFLGGAGAFALLAALGAATWYATGPDAAPAPDPVAQSPTAPNAPGSFGGAATLPGCRASLPGGGRCPAGLECFGPMRVSGADVRAERVPCAGRHTWETYAEGDLPTTVTVADQVGIKTDPGVRQVCGENSFHLATLGMTTTGWDFAVLPPSAESVAAGDRTYRCLAGKGPNGLSGPTLAR